MTQQMEDSFQYRKKYYRIIGMSNGELFDPGDWGFFTHYTHTACMRGWIADFKVDLQNCLIVDNLYANPIANTTKLGVYKIKKREKIYEWTRVIKRNRYEPSPESRRLEAEIEKIDVGYCYEGGRDDYWRDLFPRNCDDAPRFNNVAPQLSQFEDNGKFTYKNVALSLPYTGALLLARGLRQKWGGYSPSNYRTVLELYFKEGILDKVIDCSEIALTMCADKRKKGDLETKISFGERCRIIYNRFIEREISGEEMSECNARWKEWWERSDNRYWASKVQGYDMYKSNGIDFYLKMYGG